MALRQAQDKLAMIERASGLGAQPTAEFEEQRRRWAEASAKRRPRKGPGSGACDRTISDVALKKVYDPQDVADLDLARDLAWPGEYPYTRGIHPNGYRDRLWTMRQFAGFGNAKQTNERYHFLLAQGQHGLSVAFDMPTLMGYDSDQPQSRGEVGKCGVAIDSLADMEVLFDGIDMGDITTSMTINGPAAIAVAQYIAAAEKKGIPRAKLGGTIQADILKEYIAQKEWIFPPRPHMRIIVDMIQFCTAEMPKFRAARRIYARHMREKYGAKDPKSWQLRFHTQTAGCSATAQQPENNIVRVAFEAMAAVLGGTQSLHTNSMDEVLALPTEKSVEIALRTQQVLAYETNVTNVVDPLGGSYYVEALTDEMERQAEAYFAQIAEYGGVVEAIEAGFFQKEIAEASYRYQRSFEAKDRVVVGVNAFQRDDETVDMDLLRITAEMEHAQARSVQDVRARRDAAAVQTTLKRLQVACADPKDNLMPHLIDCVNAYCTEGEIVEAMAQVYGRYTEAAVL